MSYSTQLFNSFTPVAQAMMDRCKAGEFSPTRSTSISNVMLDIFRFIVNDGTEEQFVALTNELARHSGAPYQIIHEEWKRHLGIGILEGGFFESIKTPPAQDVIQTALKHVNSIIPEIDRVVYNEHGQWIYTNEDLNAYGFDDDDGINFDLLDDAASCAEYPSIHILKQPE